MELTEPAAHSLAVFRVVAGLQIQITMKHSKLWRVDLYKLHLFMFGSLHKGIVFCHQPSIINSHIILLTL
jgi:hypothetical protein